MFSHPGKKCATALLLTLLGLSATASWAQGAPGEDTITIHRGPSYQLGPYIARPMSKDANLRDTVSAGERAQTALYTAKAYSSNPGDVLTDKDVVNAVHTDGLKTTCTQNLNIPTAKTPAGSLVSQPQVVVLRGDVINVCN